MKLSSPQKIADLTGRSRQWVVDCCKDGSIEHITKNGRIYIDADRIQDYMNKMMHDQDSKILKLSTDSSSYGKFLFKSKAKDKHKRYETA